MKKKHIDIDIGFCCNLGVFSANSTFRCHNTHSFLGKTAVPVPQFGKLHARRIGRVGSLVDGDVGEWFADPEMATRENGWVRCSSDPLIGCFRVTRT